LFYDETMKREKINKEELKFIRRIHRGGISIEVMADEMGVSYHAVYYWLNGKRNPGYLVTAKIRQFLRKHTLKEKISAEGV
jgi:transposase